MAFQFIDNEVPKYITNLLFSFVYECCSTFIEKVWNVPGSEVARVLFTRFWQYLNLINSQTMQNKREFYVFVFERP